MKLSIGKLSKSNNNIRSSIDLIYMAGNDLKVRSHRKVRYCKYLPLAICIMESITREGVERTKQCWKERSLNLAS